MKLFYELVGKIAVFLIGSFFVLLLFSLVLGIILVKKHRFILPQVLLFTIDTFYLQIKNIAKKFGLGENLIDRIGIDVRNHLSLNKFAAIKPQDKILVVPQCLRDLKCPARLDPASGIKCKECGKCIINDIKEEAERLEYKMFIVPGGRFVERIVKIMQPKAALGVACCKDLNLSMHEISKANIVVQGVPLIRDGCMNTAVDVKELLNRMKLGIEDGIEDATRHCPETQLQV
ncbi:MAG: DUF116 domain-containing protein [Candidatus Hydrothermarchaeales archaeon]